MGLTAFGWLNAVKSGALAVGAAAANMGAGGLQVDQGSADSAWQTPAGILASADGAWLLIDSGDTGSVWRGFGFFRSNLTANATRRWRVSDSLSGGQVTSSSYDSGTANADVKPGYLQSILIADADQTGRYAQLDINDAGNPDNFLNIPLAFAGPLFIPRVGASWSSNFGRADATDETQTRGGQEFPNNRYIARQAPCAMGGIKSDEVWPGIMDLDRVGRLGGNVLYVLDTTSANINYEAVFGRMRNASPLSFPYTTTDARAWAATFTERL